MKKIIPLIAFVLFAHLSYGQWTGACDGPSINYIGPIDSTDFSGNQTNKFHLEIDTTLHGNIWQIGMVTKTGFPASTFGGMAIQTDTLIAYDISNTSAFMVWTDSLYNAGPFNSFDSVHSLAFWHYYDVDSLSDSCLVQITTDSGKTWLNYFDASQNVYLWMAYDYTIASNLSPINSGSFLWTGQSAGWQRVKICFNYPFPISPGKRIDQVFGFRFLFKSDSIQSNKPGWIIDKIHFFNPIRYPGGVNDLAKFSLPIYPNPSKDGHFTIDFPSTYVQGKFYVYDFLGRNIKTVPLTEQIDLSNLPRGLYSYKALFEKTEQWFSGKIEIR